MRLRLYARGIAAIGIAASLALGARPFSVEAATGIPSALATAIHNTDTVNTLVHHDTTTFTAPNGTVSFKSQGQEDEVKNTEHDYEAVTVKARDSKGKLQTLRYTIDIIFANGQTYYKSSLAQNTWKTHSGSKFPDPYTGGWQRGRTKVVVPTKPSFTQVGAESNGQIHWRTTYKITRESGTIDLWTTTSGTPYVVREDEVRNLTGQSPGQKATFKTSILFGPFNQPLNIQPPGTSTL